MKRIVILIVLVILAAWLAWWFVHSNAAVGELRGLVSHTMRE